MNFSLEKKNNVKILRLHEHRLDFHVAPSLKAELLILEDEEPHSVLIDLSNIEFADSSGLGALLLGIRQAREKGGDFGILQPQKKVLNLIRIAQLNEVVNVYENEDEALAALGSNKQSE